jgi:hypothetical protein
LTATPPDPRRLNADERRSLTHGEFWIPESEREVYRTALESLNRAGVPYVVSGLYAIHAYTGVYRQTKDLDLLMEPTVVVAAAEALKSEGFRVELVEAHWLAKALKGAQVDLIFGMANGIGFIDAAWYGHSRPAILAATPVRIAPPEELLWHRLFIGERHRFDMADVVHLILHLGSDLDWDRLLTRVGSNWRLLVSQLHFFDYVYPGHRDRIPDAVRETLHQLERADTSRADTPRADTPRADTPRADTPRDDDAAAPLCRGTMLSRFSFAIDVNEWGFEDARKALVARVRADPLVAEIRESGVWRDGDRSTPGERGP